MTKPTTARHFTRIRHGLAFVSLLWISFETAAEEVRVAFSLDIPPYIIQAENRGIEIDVFSEALP